MPSAVLGKLSKYWSPLVVVIMINTVIAFREKQMTGCKEEDTPPYSLLHRSSLPRFLPVAPFACFGVFCK